MFSSSESPLSAGTYFLSISTILLLSITMAEKSDVLSVIEGNNQFTNNLYAHITKPNENLIFSPLSVHTILSLVYQGSNGDTEAAFKAVLNVPDKSRTSKGFQNLMSDLNNIQGVTLDIANKIYLKNGCMLKPTFKEVATKQFFAEAENVDFGENIAAAKTINGWVQHKTKNKITNLVTPGDFDENTRLLLINAIYFKGDWLDKFEKSRTTKEQFYTSETDSVPCNMMHRTGKYNYKEDSDLDAQVIEIPYKNKNLSMLIVLPHSRTGIADLEKKLSKLDLTLLAKDLRYLEVKLSLPRFKIESKIDLNDPLEKLGLEHAFGKNANLSDILDNNEQLRISKAIQKAFIEVNEEGAEAAAATGVLLRKKRCLVQVSEIFEADRTFLIYLKSLDRLKRDNHIQDTISPSFTILFSGKVVLPEFDKTNNCLEHIEL